MKSLYGLILLLALFQVAYTDEHTQNFRQLQDPLITSAGSRNFTAWMKGINIPSSLQHIAYVSQDRIDQWLIDLTSASTRYPTFCNTGNDLQDKQEFAAFLAIIGSETEYTYGFPCTREQGCPDCSKCSYNSHGLQCQQDQNLQYFGRGPMQLSWDYNYADFSQSYYGDDRLVKNPTLIEKDSSVCWATAIWFWMEDHGYGGWCMPQAGWDQRDTCEKSCTNGPQGCNLSQCNQDHWLPKKVGSCHNAMHSDGSIGWVINIVNGGYDCCPTTTYFTNFGHTLKRVEWWATIVYSWGLGLPWTQLSPVPIQECPRATGHIDCTQLKTNQYCWNCCSSI